MWWFSAIHSVAAEHEHPARVARAYTSVSTQMVRFATSLSKESIVDVEGVVSLPKDPLKATTQQVSHLGPKAVSCQPNSTWIGLFGLMNCFCARLTGRWRFRSGRSTASAGRSPHFHSTSRMQSVVKQNLRRLSRYVFSFASVLLPLQEALNFFFVGMEALNDYCFPALHISCL